MNEDLQTRIDRTSPGGTLQLTPPRSEIQGPILLRRPITILGQGCSFWAEKGPVLQVLSSGVVLTELNIEVTGAQTDAMGDESHALVVGPKLGITTTNVVVRGNVAGLDGEEGEWRYPRTLRLGGLKAGQKHQFTIRMMVPVACQFLSEISGLDLSSPKLPPGPAEVTLTLEAMKEGTRLRGFLKLRTPLLTRQIQVTCHFQNTAQAVVGTGQCIDQPKDWAALLAAPVAMPTPTTASAELTSPPVARPDPIPVDLPPPPPVSVPLPPEVLSELLVDDIPEALPADAPDPAPAQSSRPSRHRRRPHTRPPEVFQPTAPVGATVPTEPEPESDPRRGSIPLSPLWGGPSVSAENKESSTSEEVSDVPQAAPPAEDDSAEPATPRPTPSRTRRPAVSSFFLPSESSSAPSPPPEPTEAASEPQVPSSDPVSNEADRPRKRTLRTSRGLPGVFGDSP